jgi:hypothetical protein
VPELVPSTFSSTSNITDTHFLLRMSIRGRRNPVGERKTLRDLQSMQRAFLQESAITRIPIHLACWLSNGGELRPKT